MEKGNKKKQEQLEMSGGKASNKLRKAIMYHLAKKLDEHYCFRCGVEIESIEDFTIDHKEPWLDSENPSKLFFSLDNIAFSHSYCNSSVARRVRNIDHPSIRAYKNGCKCMECVKLNSEKGKKSMQKFRSKA